MNDVLRMLLYLPAQGSRVAQDLDLLHFFLIGTTMAGSSLVGLVTVWFAFRYRRRSEDELTQRIHAPVWLEWGVAVTLLGMFLVFWVIGLKMYERLQVTPPGSMDVYVTAKQWMWKFAYPGGQSSISSLVVPVGRPVRLVMTSRDVIHSFYVPAFRQKQDVLPGRYTTTWFQARTPGTYEIFCAEYCGTGHSQMLGTVVALPPREYERWLEGTPPPALAGIAGAHAGETMVERGKDAAARHGCLSCHTLDGQKHVGPTWRGLYGREELLQDGRRVRVDEAYLTRSMMDPASEVVAGFSPVMPTYQGLLQPGDVGALLELIKALREPLPDPVDASYPPLWPGREPPLTEPAPGRASPGEAPP